MGNIFPKWTNRIPQAIGLGAPLVAGFVVFAVWYWFSPKFTDVGYQPEQPVHFSHRIHAGELGLDCRFCHFSVERSAYAAIPSTDTCMSCHKSVLPNSDQLAPVRASAETGKPIKWVRVHMLPDYAFFNHSVHIAAGVSCVTCHGRVDTMDKVTQKQPLSMSWCLNCHRDPKPNLRPVKEVTNLQWKGDPQQDPAIKRKIFPPVSCSGCHR